MCVNPNDGIKDLGHRGTFTSGRLFVMGQKAQQPVSLFNCQCPIYGSLSTNSSC